VFGTTSVDKNLSRHYRIKHEPVPKRGQARKLCLRWNRLKEKRAKNEFFHLNLRLRFQTFSFGTASLNKMRSLIMALMRLGRKFNDLGITGGFARWYDKNTRENRIGEMREYAKEAKKHLTDNANVLEIAPGPGYFSIELAKMGNFDITGMDISAEFVEICKTNAKRENVSINFLQGNVSKMPFENGAFDFIFCSAAFKNFKEPLTALHEMYRVLKDSGIVLIVDMNHDVSKEKLAEEAAKISKSGFERWFMKKTFKGLCKGAYSKNELKNMIKQTSFNKNEINEEGISLYIYLYK
jgi:ubiquinone/menaquinone biosynthesis C-methylase UbiE